MNSLKARVKVVVQVEEKDTPCWPCINYDFQKELDRIMKQVTDANPQITFDVKSYTQLEQAENDYEDDRKKYDGILVLLMTCWKGIDLFYARHAKSDGLPVIIADVPFCGSGSILRISKTVLTEKLPVPLISSHDYGDIAKAPSLFSVIAKMKTSKILIISNTIDSDIQKAVTDTWGCTFINKNASDLHAVFQSIDDHVAQEIAEHWKSESAGVIEPNNADIEESAKLYLALSKIKNELQADAITVDCLTLSYANEYGNHKHMYPCLSHFEMSKNGEVAVCEADINATIASLVNYYLTGRPGFVSDPVIDTSSGRIIYAHCVASTKVFGADDPRCCKYYIRSHAEDKCGAAIQVDFPIGEKLTSTTFNFPDREAIIHSSRSVGNVGGDEGCRSKLAALTNADNILKNWIGGWHRVTVFGDYRKQFLQLFVMKGLTVQEEDLL